MSFALPELLVALAVAAILANWYRHRRGAAKVGRQLKRLFHPKSKW